MTVSRDISRENCDFILVIPPRKRRVTPPAPMITLIEMDSVTQKALDESKKKIDKLEAEWAHIEPEWSVKADALKEEQQCKLFIEQKVEAELRKAQEAADKQFCDKVMQSIVADEQANLKAHTIKFNIAPGL